MKELGGKNVENKGEDKKFEQCRESWLLVISSKRLLHSLFHTLKQF